jgi:hypothetical protein
VFGRLAALEGRVFARCPRLADVERALACYGGGPGPAGEGEGGGGAMFQAAVDERSVCPWDLALHELRLAGLAAGHLEALLLPPDGEAEAPAATTAGGEAAAAAAAMAGQNPCMQLEALPPPPADPVPAANAGAAAAAHAGCNGDGEAGGGADDDDDDDDGGEAAAAAAADRVLRFGSETLAFCGAEGLLDYAPLAGPDGPDAALWRSLCHDPFNCSPASPPPPPPEPDARPAAAASDGAAAAGESGGSAAATAAPAAAAPCRSFAEMCRSFAHYDAQRRDEFLRRHRDMVRAGTEYAVLSQAQAQADGLAEQGESLRREARRAARGGVAGLRWLRASAELLRAMRQQAGTLLAAQERAPAADYVALRFAEEYGAPGPDDEARAGQLQEALNQARMETASEIARERE